MTTTTNAFRTQQQNNTQRIIAGEPVIENFYKFLQILPKLNPYVYKQQVLPDSLTAFLQNVMDAVNMLYTYLVKQVSTEPGEKELEKDIDVVNTVYDISTTLGKYIPPGFKSDDRSKGDVIDSDGRFFKKFLMLHSTTPNEVTGWMSMFNKLDTGSKSKITLTSRICMKLIYYAIDYNIPDVRTCPICGEINEITKPYQFEKID